MKILGTIFGFIVKMIAGSFIWFIIALITCFPFGLVALKITDHYVNNNSAFYTEINNNISLVYALFVVTCFVGVIVARIVAVSIKTLADKKLAQKTQKS